MFVACQTASDPLPQVTVTVSPTIIGSFESVVDVSSLICTVPPFVERYRVLSVVLDKTLPVNVAVVV